MSPFLSRTISPTWVAACFALLALAGTAYALCPLDTVGEGGTPTIDANVKDLGTLVAGGAFASALADNPRFLLRLTALVPWSATCFLLSNGLLLSLLLRNRAELRGPAAICALLLVVAADAYLVLSWTNLARVWMTQYQLIHAPYSEMVR